ncbi:MAG: rhodanese-like domain-containing protein [Acidobacteriota bacterium]
MTTRILSLAALALVSLLPLRAADEPWTEKELLPPATLAKRLSDGDKPFMIFVGPGFLFRTKHIPGASDAGMASKPEGMAALMALVKGKSPDTEIILYCGCCPMNVCPNIRPAVKALKEAGYKNVKLLHLPTRLADDWTSKGYPVESSN